MEDRRRKREGKQERWGEEELCPRMSPVLWTFINARFICSVPWVWGGAPSVNGLSGCHGLVQLGVTVPWADVNLAADAYSCWGMGALGWWNGSQLAAPMSQSLWKLGGTSCQSVVRDNEHELLNPPLPNSRKTHPDVAQDTNQQNPGTDLDIF